MAVTVDTANIVHIGGGDIPSLALAVTVDAADNFLGVGACYWRDNLDPNLTITAITYDGVAMTSIKRENGTPAGDISELFGLFNPHIGTFNLIVTFSASDVYGSIGAVPLGGVGSIGIPASTVGSGTSSSLAVASNAGDVVLDVITDAVSLVATGTGQTLAWSSSSDEPGGSSTTTGASGTTTVSYTFSSSGNFTTCAVALSPAVPAPRIFVS